MSFLSILHLANTGLLIIDVQEKIINAVTQKNLLLKNLSLFIQAFKIFNLPILVAKQLNARISGFETVLFELIKYSKSSYFKPISQLIKSHHFH